MEKIDKSVSICMLARDCGKAIERNIPRIENLRSFFCLSYVIVVENDSKDNTKSVLAEWADKTTNTIIAIFNILMTFIFIICLIP